MRKYPELSDRQWTLRRSVERVRIGLYQYNVKTSQ